MGTFGYFPTYALGNLYAAQFFAAAQRDVPDLQDRIARGDLRTLLDWLCDRIHRHGQRYRAGELMQVVSGRPISADAFMEYIQAKYAPIYGL
jgi:carboxypeptidase Taq